MDQSQAATLAGSGAEALDICLKNAVQPIAISDID